MVSRERGGGEGEGRGQVDRAVGGFSSSGLNCNCRRITLAMPFVFGKDEDGCRETTHTRIHPMEEKVETKEIERLQTYLRGLFELPELSVRRRERKADSADVYIGDEFIGVLFREEEEGELSYAFNMAILDIDLVPEGKE